MAKTMAQIDKNGVVTNVLWYSDNQPDSEYLKNIGDKSVAIGDRYRDDKWYRGDEEILSPSGERIKALESEVAALREGNNALTQCVLEMSEIVYA